MADSGRSARLSVLGCCLLSNERVLLGALSLIFHATLNFCGLFVAYTSVVHFLTHMLSLHTNSPLLSAVNNLDRAGKRLSDAQTRLSTGYRINSAADDAAGLQIATRLAAQSSGMAVAMRNTQNTMSILQTADGLMGEADDILHRMSDLAVAAADASSTDADRAGMNAEYVSLSEQVLDIVNESRYGGAYLFRYIVAPPGPNGPGMMGLGPMHFQIGASADESITEDFRPELGRLNASLYYAIDQGNLDGYPVDGPGTDLLTSDAANGLIGTLAEASEDVGALRARFGALGNRMESVFNNLTNMRTNTDRARGQIMDTDYATETAIATRNQMLMNAGTAMIKNATTVMQLAKSLIE